MSRKPGASQPGQYENADALLYMMRTRGASNAAASATSVPAQQASAQGASSVWSDGRMPSEWKLI